ncbi:MAG TPA: prepilin-type N-terminal cleavage/methylation domain-containing protein [Sulfurovum sp.]|nr:prepilin-type N-terminal cleavage/methylation domain-containing protein [Sulfurovum sp.]
MRTLHKHTKAFTMMELVFVIVVLGILASLALTRMDRDIRQEAADNILSAIRYTQHLALNDDKTNPFINDWQKSLWTIRFSSDGDHYTIGSDVDREGNIDKIEAAVDPINGKYIYNNSATPQADESPDIFLNKKYGITSISITNGCGNPAGTATSTLHIAFDNLGRPFRGVSDATNNYDRYINQDCTLTFSAEDAFPGEPILVNISRETGYAYIVGQEDY